ncbi:MAG TPA: hypothetical protein VLB89_06745 [Gaiellaceae bacterium]|nr:hypothetical protein [Gaiellaceae bacterium]
MTTTLAPPVERPLFLTTQFIFCVGRKLPLFREIAEETSEQPTVRVSGNRQVNLVEVNHRPEQIQIERSEH